MGKRMSSILDLRPRQNNWQHTIYTWTQINTWLGFKSRRRHASRPASGTPAMWRQWKCRHSNWCIPKLRLCIPGIQRYSCQHSKSYHCYYDQKCVSTDNYDNRPMLSFCLPCETRNRWRLRSQVLSCNHEPWTNYRSLRRKACHDKNATEIVFRRISQIMAQLFTTGHFKLQCGVSHEYQLWT